MARINIDVPAQKAIVAPVAQRIVDTIANEIRPGLLLSKEDEVLILLSAAYGSAKRSGFTREKLEAMRQQVFDMLDETRV